jgi:hypothetical protein
MHNVTVEHDNDNWARWGKLVVSWIEKPESRPTSVGALRKAMDDAGVDGAAVGSDGTTDGGNDRGVTMLDYGGPDHPVIIPLPTAGMIEYDKKLLDEIDAKPLGQRHYPLPVFYSVAFGGAPMVDLSKDELYAMMLRRLGEYVINECM